MSDLDLAAFQRRFAAGLAADPDDPAAAAALAEFAPAGALSPAAGMAVVRANATLLSERTLRALYPVAARLVGPRAFGWLAAGYAAAHPSHSPNLNDYGAAFADHIGALPQVQADVPYLPDVARLEWAWHRIHYDGGVAEPGEAGLALARPAFLVASPYPVRTIWQAHQGEAEPPSIDLDAGGERTIVWRRDTELRAEPVPDDLWPYLQAATDPATLLDWLNARIATDGEVRVQQAIAACVARGWLVGTTG